MTCIINSGGLNDLPEPRLGTETGESRINFKIDRPGIALLERLLQPQQRSRTIAQTLVGSCEIGWAGWTFPSPGLESFCYNAPVSLGSIRAESPVEIRNRRSLQAQTSSDLNRVLQLACVLISPQQVQEVSSIFRVQPQSGL